MESVTVLQQLPVEIWAAILGYVSERELRCAASTSRLLRGVALEHAGLCLSFRCIICYSEPARRRNQNRLREVVDHARSQSRPLDLALDSFFLPTSDQTAFVSECLSDALPLLVKLSLDFVGGFPPNIYSALNQAAPRLQELHICGSPCRILNGVISSTAVLPVTFLSGLAPRLTILELHDIFLSAALPPDTFKRVLDLKVTYTSAIPRMNIALLFPSVRTLEIRCEARRVLPGPGHWQPATFDLRGLLALDRLMLEVDSGLMHELDQQLADSPRVIPSVRRYVTDPRHPGFIPRGR